MASANQTEESEVSRASLSSVWFAGAAPDFGPRIRKIRAPIKIKSALPPPPKTPPQNAEFYGKNVFSCRKNAFSPGVHKIGAAISGPRIADTNFTDTRIFLTGFRSARQMLCGEASRILLVRLQSMWEVWVGTL